MTQLNPFSIPGHARLSEKYLIDLIREAFELKLNIWVTARSRVDEYCIPRQVLMAALLDFCDYTGYAAGNVCHRSQPDAIHAHRKVHETLMTDPVYGWRVRAVYEHLRAQNRIPKTMHKGGLVVGENNNYQ